MCMLIRTYTSNETLLNNEHSTVIIRISLSTLVFVLNSILVAGLIKSWSKFRQNIYIFVLAIVTCDALLGLVNAANGIHHLVTGNVLDKSGARYRYGTAWFYMIKSSIFMAAEVFTAGHTALIALAFSRYISAQSHQHMEQLHKRNTAPGSSSQMNKSLLLSRKKSWILSLNVFVLSLAIFIIGLCWNCTSSCSCFFDNGKLSRTMAAHDCHRHFQCSFLYPSLKIYHVIACVIAFLVALLIVLVMCVGTIHRTGGLAAILPYRIHLSLLRRNIRKKKDETDDTAGAMALHRKHSIQLSYMRNMTHFILSVSIVYVACRFPANIVLLLDSLQIPITISPVGLAAIGTIAFSHSLLNPVVFYVTLQPMRKAVHHLFQPCCTRTIETKRGTTTTDTTNTNITSALAQNRKRSQLSARISVVSTVSINENETTF
ncbi:uncharacterized protein LOC100186465 [Ciona intestinalis]